ncbi:MAG: ribosome small subunit-dependent GTPase A, partial [Bdellovibrionales bacterium]|nr:ribosome small subunit-dependent GTPase A [Bdellovibrionales bacterium]
QAGIVIEVAGRSLRIVEGSEVRIAKLASRATKPLVGDLVSSKSGSDDSLVELILPRKNKLSRTFSYQDREIVANLDALLLITAVGALFNPIALDRVLSVASAEGIPVALILNKIDLGVEDRFAVYASVVKSIFSISAKYGDGLEGLSSFLEDPQLRVVALCGVSGVGKSTLLNRLAPQAESRTQEVSLKTGQGRQTTSQAIGHLIDRGRENPSLVLVDLPGVQQFGVSNLSEQTIRASFPEFERLVSGCRYKDCRHLEEPECHVKAVLGTLEMPTSRYESYRNMLEELENLPESRKYGRKRE